MTEVKWNSIKKYMEENNYDFDQKEWGEIREKIGSLRGVERNRMQMDIAKRFDDEEKFKKIKQIQFKKSKLSDIELDSMIKLQRKKYLGRDKDV
jgi:hypothetical protein